MGSILAWLKSNVLALAIGVALGRFVLVRLF